jgi:hypothetical protein
VLDRCHSYGTELLFSEISLHVLCKGSIHMRWGL